jgi:hypothetical protein
MLVTPEASMLATLLLNADRRNNCEQFAGSVNVSDAVFVQAPVPSK